MTTMQKPAVRKRTRKTKQEMGEELLAKDFAQPSGALDKFIPTKSQKELINKIRQYTLTFVDSVAGTGKSSAVLYHYCKEYLVDNKKKLIVIRTPVEAGEDKIGFLCGPESEKLSPHFSSVKDLITKFIGKGKLEADLEKRIFFKTPNFMLGCTMDDSLVLIDEAQQLSPMILKLLLERTGNNTKVVIAGCSSQIYATNTKRNALKDAIGRFFTQTEDGTIEAVYSDMAYHEFDIEECHRSDVVKDVIRAYKEF